MLLPPPAQRLGPVRLFVIFILALLALNYGIPAYFRSLPLVDQFGRAICRVLFDI